MKANILAQQNTSPHFWMNQSICYGFEGQRWVWISAGTRPEVELPAQILSNYWALQGELLNTASERQMLWVLPLIQAGFHRWLIGSHIFYFFFKKIYFASGSSTLINATTFCTISIFSGQFRRLQKTDEWPNWNILLLFLQR